ncbi:hypothetical protein [Paraburkholderia acidisoli]|uniref:Uncharacterized protein n=1 Tax=Paraburkholderia acidisoli TaxID=2571748 RepID=A0A7Z2GN39_9BURK|nr:hypothetical protein [Paraburkholderia acidisoli]QGZ64429.1 hypothetical protein FAZ98_22180 [Paraburkholderia acidisoli]
MRPARAFFDLQVRFAHEAARLTGAPLVGALLEWTNLYVRFGAGRAFDPAHPLWAAYSSGIDESAPLAQQCEWTWRYLQRCPTHRASPYVIASFGCFAYARDAHGGVRLHFDPRVDRGMSPLDIRRRHARRAELQRLIEHVCEHDPAWSSLELHGTSWLYNVPAYRGLFPDVYVASAQPVPRWRALSLWGQFLDRHGALREMPAAGMLTRVAQLRNIEEGIAQCFPFQALAVSAPIQLLREHFSA